MLARLPVIAITPLAAEPALDLVAFGVGARRRSKAGPGGSARRRRSRNTEPCIWPDRPIPATVVAGALRRELPQHLDRGLPPGLRLLLGPARAGRQQRVGRGGAGEHGAVSPPAATPLAPLVPMSMPMVTALPAIVLSSSLSRAVPPGFTRNGPSSIACDRFAAAVPPTSLYETATLFVPCRSRPRRRRPSRPAQGPDGGGGHAPADDAGIRLTFDRRGYRPTISLDGFETKILKPQNIVEMLHLGSRDLGFAGADWVVEKGAELVELVDTGARSGADRGGGRAGFPRWRAAGQAGLRGRDRV